MQAGEWSIRESFIAVVVGNLPMLYTLYQRIQSYGPSSFSKSTDKRGYPLGSYRTGGSSKAGRKAKKFQHPLSMPNDTAMGSDERIVVEPKQEHGTGPTMMADGGPPEYYRGGVQNHEPGIRVETELRVETSDGSSNVGDRGNEYHTFP